MTAEKTGSGAASQRSGLDPSAIGTASATDVGRVRSINQDAFGEFEDHDAGRRLLFVADGMGGHRAGEVASRLAVEQVGEGFAASRAEPEQLLRSMLERANQEIFQAASEDDELAGMGTTGIALLLTGESRGWIGHVGDSRAYRLRDASFSQLTSDHSVVGELVRRGQLSVEEARHHPQSNEILRALGTQPAVEVELTEVDILPGDRFLLCSDGLTTMLRDPEIGEVLAREEPEQAVRTLIELANEAGGSDNITIMIADIPASASAQSSATPALAAAGERDAGAAGSLIRWAVALVLVAGVLFLLFCGPGSDAGG